MNHREFIDSYKTGKLLIYVNKDIAFKLMETNLVRKRYLMATLVWTWIWFLAIPSTILLFMFKKFLFALVFLFFSVGLPAAIKKSACEFVIEQALEDEIFYKAIIELKGLEISMV